MEEKQQCKECPTLCTKVRSRTWSLTSLLCSCLPLSDGHNCLTLSTHRSTKCSFPSLILGVCAHVPASVCNYLCRCVQLNVQPCVSVIACAKGVCATVPGLLCWQQLVESLISSTAQTQTANCGAGVLLQGRTNTMRQKMAEGIIF